MVMRNGSVVLVIVSQIIREVRLVRLLKYFKKIKIIKSFLLEEVSGKYSEPYQPYLK